MGRTPLCVGEGENEPLRLETVDGTLPAVLLAANLRVCSYLLGCSHAV